MRTSSRATGSASAGTSRRRTALAVLVFVLAVVAFDRIFFTALQLAQPPVDRRSELRKKLDGLPDKRQYRMLILGTSRTFDAVHPAYIARELGIRSYKEAFQGKGPRYNYEFYQLYERVVGRPKWVIYGVDYFLFEITSEQWAMDRFNMRADARGGGQMRGGVLLTLANKPADDRTIVRALEALQERMVVPSGHQFDAEKNPADMDAYLGPDVYQPTGREIPVTFDPKPFPPFPGAEGRYFARLLEQWRAEGVGVMLIYTPDYVRVHERNYEHAKAVACFRRLIQNHPNCVFIDYCDPRKFPLYRASFFEEGGRPIAVNSHLSKYGVVEFNRLFIPDLRRFIQGSEQRADY